MVPPSGPPPYAPAPHLVAHSRLTSEQLVNQFQDFRSHLPHVAAAPSLVFERLVGNLSEAFNSAVDLENKQRDTALQICQASNEQLEKQLAELKAAIPVVASQDPNHTLGSVDSRCSNCNTLCITPSRAGFRSAVLTATNLVDTSDSGGQGAATDTPIGAPTVEFKPNPATRAFSTTELRGWWNVRAHTSKVVKFVGKHSAAPMLPTGLTMLDIGSNTSLCVKAYHSHIQKDSCNINLDSWAGTSLYGASCEWLEIGTNDPDWQSGIYDTLEDHPRHEYVMENSRTIHFAHAYSAPPVVVVWLTELDMSKDQDWRVKTFATNVMRTGFTIHINTWGDSVLYSGVATWVAYPATRIGVDSGRFRTLDIHSPKKSQYYTTGYKEFKGNVFTSPPRVLVALDSFDISHDRVLRLVAKVSSITATGMTWHLDTWLNTTVYSASASYIALI